MKTNVVVALMLAGSIAFSEISLTSCSDQGMTRTGKGAAIGTAGGVAVGAALGAILGKGKGAAIGAAVGGAVGSGTGLLIGRRMDKQAAELAAIQNAQVEQVTDANNLQAIKVTFASGILFPTNGSTLSDASKAALSQFATSLINSPQTDVTIYGHTDNTGSLEVNEKLSAKRAESVSSYLINSGVNYSRIKTQGMAYNMPVADNSTAAGRAQNRRVEIYITASAEMIQAANEGKLQ